MKKPVVGKTVKGSRDVKLDPGALLQGHLLAVASSGGGKSWLIRVLLEQTFGMFPHIVIDVEGEFKTLREKFDYIIASADGDGDCLADHRTAKLLARRLLELKASCIIDIYELDPIHREIFVRDFCKALINAPRNLWGPRLTVIDEAHDFAPEKGKAESKSAVCNLLSKGRKRGFGTILASQRVAKLSKDAISECRNKMYGFCNLLADRKRATEDLGFISKKDQDRFRLLDFGQFYAVGPAISKREVILMKTANVKTTHPRPGEGIQAHTPPPKAKVKKLLGEFKDLPQQARKEVENLNEAKREITALRRELTVSKKAEPKAVVKKEGLSKQEHAQLVRDIKAQVGELVSAQQEPIVAAFQEIVVAQDGLIEALRQVKSVAADGLKALNKDPVRGTLSGRTPTDKPNVSNRPKPMDTRATSTPVRQGDTNQDRSWEKVPSNGDFKLGNGGDRRMLEALVKCHPMKITKAQWGSMAKMTHTGGSFQTYISKLRVAGLFHEEGDLFFANENTFDLLGMVADAPQTGLEMIEMWKRILGGTPAKMIDIVADANTGLVVPLTREALADAVGMTASGGSFLTYISKLKTNGLISVQGEHIHPGAMMNWEPE